MLNQLLSVCAGISGKFDEISDQVEPASVVLNAWEAPYPEYVKYAIKLEFGSNEISVGYLFGSEPVTFAQLVPPFTDRNI